MFVHGGAYIRQRRQAAGLSLRRLAETAGVSPAYLSRVERGVVPPSQVFVRKLAAALRIGADELLLLTGRVPSGWYDAIAASPARAVEALRGALASRVAEAVSTYGPTVLAFDGTRAIEDADFPFESLSDIAELESWRKEINRPVYHIHKWWAQRLGSVFRAILLGAFAPKGSNVREMFYQPARLPGAVVFDPFMGSGTTVGEALKMGARAIGRDINPVAHFIVRNALGVHSRAEVLKTFRAIQRDVAAEIQRFYRARLADGHTAEVLYYFWVKAVACPRCDRQVDLFSSYVFAQHAYPGRNPAARALCPHCGAINPTRFDVDRVTCAACRRGFKPKAAPVRGAKATCAACGQVFVIAKAVQELGQPPGHRLYAKMVLRGSGSKEYLRADDYDVELYEEASQALKKRQHPYPIVRIFPGHNTNQVLNYCYTHWHQMFNERQLLCLSLLAERIRAVPEPGLRELFACLFSGTLEFNNMFASFKGEGTGAVRHMFSHHILKPERTPLEANLWGTPRSSGAFSTLFEGRLLRALDYRDNPFEVRPARTGGRVRGEKVYGLSCPLGYDIAASFSDFDEGRQVYLSCGDSAQTDLPGDSVDAVITDPPFFDNVHYSELADFFYVWQRHLLHIGDGGNPATTRSPAEVQHGDAGIFAERLAGVWAECERVLRPHGLLVFTYHHSRVDGWRCVLEAVVKAGFRIVAAHPIKAEMSLAAPKHQAREPVDLDIILVCRKRGGLAAHTQQLESIVADAFEEAQRQVARLSRAARRLSLNDARVVLMAQIIKRLSWRDGLGESVRYLSSVTQSIESAVRRLHNRQRTSDRSVGTQTGQLALW